MTRKFIFSMLYAATALGANPVLADPINLSEIAELRAGDMQKLVVHSEPKEMADAGFYDEAGNETSLDAYAGKIVLLNFWATWCAPCRAEMPALDALQADLGGDNFAVVTVATGRNPVPAIKSFFDKTDVKNLPILLDPKRDFSRVNSVFGLPTTMILDTEGNEIARMQGDADWHSAEALTVLQAIIDSSAKNES